MTWHEMIDELDKPDEAIVKKFSAKYGAEEAAEALSELRGLEREGQLYSQDALESYLAKNPLRRRRAIVKALCLHVAHDCNLRRRYCFASTGDSGTGRSLMPVSTAKRAIDFLIEKSRGRRNLEVDFFGGEPLLNFDTRQGNRVLCTGETEGDGQEFQVHAHYQCLVS